MLGRWTGALPEAQLLYARALYLNANFEAAQRKALDVLRGCPEDMSAHLLVVSTYVHQGRPADALAALEGAVSSNFGIRDTPLYHVVNAEVLVANGRLEEARKVGISVPL